MTKHDAVVFHKLYGSKKPRVFYDKKDFLDYLLMIGLSAVVIGVSYGVGRVMSTVGFTLCAFMVVSFVKRHGIELRVPLLLRRPQDAFYLFAYKLQNLKPVYFVALGVLLLENVLIAATPTLPHHVEATRKVAWYLFYIHFVFITGFRTAMLVDHLAKRELVREVLMQTPWRRAIKENTNITWEIVHAYCTGVLTHIILIAPWYLVIKYCRFSVLFLPVVFLINIVVHQKWYRVFNQWFYRDHWLGHNSEFEFLFLHGTHHDAIPSGMIAVAENGLLEGFARYTLGSPIAVYDPIVSFLLYTFEITSDIESHQYIPGVFPRMPRKTLETFQHSTHHYGSLEPYSIASRTDQSTPPGHSKKGFEWIPNEIENSIQLDEQLTGFKWDNPIYRRTLALWDKYQQ
jgi:hypothetical protein